MDTTIIRDPRPDEVNGPVSGDDASSFLPIINSKGPVKSDSDKFHEKVEKKVQEFLKLKKPYCRRCAYLDYKKVKSDIIGAEKTGYADFKKLGIKMPNLEEYGKPDRFEKLKEGEELNPGKWKGAQPTFDKWIRYKCKVRGCQITIFQ